MCKEPGKERKKEKHMVGCYNIILDVISNTVQSCILLLKTTDELSLLRQSMLCNLHQSADIFLGMVGFVNTDFVHKVNLASG